MTQQQIEAILDSSIDYVASNISRYAVNPETDFTRRRDISPETLMTFLISQGSSSTRVEMFDFWGADNPVPSASALNQQRAKLKPEALEAVMLEFNSAVFQNSRPRESDGCYRFLAADGSTATFFSKPSFAPDEYYCSPGNSAKGVYSIHINAFMDLDAHIYTAALLQPVRGKDEFRAFCDLVDRHDILTGCKNVYIGDRGYCSYNNMAHVLEQGQFFLFRAKDVHSKGLVGNFDFPDSESFDIDVTVTLTRSNAKSVAVRPSTYRRMIDRQTSFDYIEYGSHDTYELSFRIVRFPIGDDSYECLVTNLPRDEFPPEELKKVYFRRWGIESSFRKLKYTIGLSNFHAYKPEYVSQEIWASLIAYNLTETMINNTIIESRETKHAYKINFTTAAHLCRVCLRLSTETDRYDLMLLLRRELIPIRYDRQYPRLQTAHFRRPRYFIYRAA